MVRIVPLSKTNVSRARDKLALAAQEAVNVKTLLKKQDPRLNEEIKTLLKIAVAYLVEAKGFLQKEEGEIARRAEKQLTLLASEKQKLRTFKLESEDRKLLEEGIRLLSGYLVTLKSTIKSLNEINTILDEKIRGFGRMNLDRGPPVFVQASAAIIKVANSTEKALG